MTLKPRNETDDEQDAAEKLHEEMISVDGNIQAPLRGENGRLLKGSPKMFYDQIRKRLSSVGIDYDKLDDRTSVDSPPDCFTENGSDYSEWMRLAAVEPVPIRFDLPGEPNYCHDCTPTFKRDAMKAGTCLFPNTRFEVRKDMGEKETIGVSRSHSVPPEHYVVYQHMTVPVTALHQKLRDYVTRFPRRKEFTRADLPEQDRELFARINRSHTEVLDDPSETETSS